MDTLCGNSLIISTKPRSHVACVCSWTKAVLALTNDSNNADSIYYHRAQQISEPWGLVLSRTHWSSHSYRVAILLQQLSILHAKNTRYQTPIYFRALFPGYIIPFHQSKLRDATDDRIPSQQNEHATTWYFPRYDYTSARQQRQHDTGSTHSHVHTHRYRIQYISF